MYKERIRRIKNKKIKTKINKREIHNIGNIKNYSVLYHYKYRFANCYDLKINLKLLILNFFFYLFNHFIKKNN